MFNSYKTTFRQCLDLRKYMLFTYHHLRNCFDNKISIRTNFYFNKFPFDLHLYYNPIQGYIQWLPVSEDCDFCSFRLIKQKTTINKIKYINGHMSLPYKNYFLGFFSPGNLLIYSWIPLFIRPQTPTQTGSVLGF